MKSFFIILASLVFLSGCTKDVEVVKKEEVVVKSQVLSPWPEGAREFQTALYFMRMAQDPNLRLRYQPENLFNICKCVLQQMEKDFEYKVFMSKFNSAVLQPENQQYIYNATYGCSVNEVQRMKKLLPKIELKDTI